MICAVPKHWWIVKGMTVYHSRGWWYQCSRLDTRCCQLDDCGVLVRCADRTGMMKPRIEQCRYMCCCTTIAAVLFCYEPRAHDPSIRQEQSDHRPYTHSPHHSGTQSTKATR